MSAINNPQATMTPDAVVADQRLNAPSQADHASADSQIDREGNQRMAADAAKRARVGVTRQRWHANPQMKEGESSQA